MKHTITALAILACFLMTSCVSLPQKRGVDDIFHDIIQTCGDSTATDRFVTLMDEYADSLYSEILNSPLDEAGLRAIAQRRAGDAMFLCLDYLSAQNPNISDLVEKFDKVLTTWRVVPLRDDGQEYAYIKEVLFVANKETDHESDEIVSFIIRDSDDSQSVVMIPDDDFDAQLDAIFYDKAPKGSDQLIDFNNGDSFLCPDDMYYERNARCFEFRGSEFYRQMMAHDFLFVTYTLENGGYESVMVSLDRFHNLVDENTQYNNGKKRL